MSLYNLTQAELELVKAARVKALELENKDKNETEARKEEAQKNLKKKGSKFLKLQGEKNKFVENFFTDHLVTKGFLLEHLDKKTTFTVSYYATHGPEFDAMKKQVEVLGMEIQGHLDKMKATEGTGNCYALWDTPKDLRDLIEFAMGMDERFGNHEAKVAVKLSATHSYTQMKIVSTRKVKVQVREWDEDGNRIEKFTFEPLYTLYYNEENEGYWGIKKGISVNTARFKYAPRDDMFSKGRYSGNAYVYKVPGSMLKKMKELDETVEWNKKRAKANEQKQNKAIADEEYTQEKFAELVANTPNVEESDKDLLMITLKNGVTITVHTLCSEQRKEFKLDYANIELPVKDKDKFSPELFAKFMEFIQTAELIKK